MLGALAFLGSEARDQLLDDSPRGMLSSKLLVAPGEPGGSEEEGSDEEGDAEAEEAAGGMCDAEKEDCTRLSGRLWRRRREDAFAAFEQALVRVAGGAAAQLAAKMTEVLASMLTPQALFGTDEGSDGVAPSTTVGGAAAGGAGAARLPGDQNPVRRVRALQAQPVRRKGTGGERERAARGARGRRGRVRVGERQHGQPRT